MKEPRPAELAARSQIYLETAVRFEIEAVAPLAQLTNDNLILQAVSDITDLLREASERLTFIRDRSRALLAVSEKEKDALIRDLQSSIRELRTCEEVGRSHDEVLAKLGDGAQ